MTQTVSTEKKCEFCDKRGLPLLLVRDAIAPNDTSAPKSADGPIDLPAHAAHFTRRLLRAGFVNVYDEARNRWEAYNVTADGYFFKMPLKPGTIPIKPGKPFNCTDLGHRAVAGCITVPDPTNATKVWIGFSDALWTPRTREKNMSKAYREKHMIELDVAAMLGGGEQKHCRPIAQVSAVVAEYAMSTQKGQQAVEWSFHQFYGRHGSAERLQAECDKLRKGKGQIVTVPDPAGIAAELAQLMKRNVAFFNRDPLRARLLAADTTIAGIEAGVRDNAILEKQKSEDERARNLSQTMAYSPEGRKRLRESAKAARDFTEAERKLAGDEAWEKYAEKFNDKERKAWKDKYTRNLGVYSTKWVDPLATKHVAVMTSAALVNHFEGNFDSQDVHSGAVYTNTVNRCAEGSLDQAACARLYADWIEGDFRDRKNFLLRALMLNQETLAKKIEETVKVTIDLRAIPWDNLIGVYEQIAEKVGSGAGGVVTNSLVTFIGAITSFIAKWTLDTKYGRRGAVLAMGMIAKYPAVRIEVTDKRIAFRRLLAKELVLRSGVHENAKKLHQAIGAQLTLQGINGDVLPGNVRTTWIVFVDRSIPGVSASATEAERIAHLLKYVRTAQDVDNLNLGRFRSLLGADVGFGVLAAAAQYAALTKLIEDESKADKGGKTEARFRLLAGSVALAATTGEVILQGYKSVVLLKNGVTYPVSGIVKLIGRARVLGCIGALIVAVFDGYNAVKSLNEGNVKMAGLYAGAAVAGFGLGVILAFPGLVAAAALVPVIAALFVAVVVIGILIEYFKDNPVQDWLERCYWGILSSERYPNQSAEQAAYDKVLKV